MDDTSLLALAFDLAARAGETILAVRAHGFETMHKTDASPVTIADQKAEVLIVAALRAATPDVPVVPRRRSRRATCRRRPPASVCRPLDGTREFTAGRDDFAVCIGLVCDGRPVLGVVGAPAKGVVYGGIVGRGAVKRSVTGEQRSPRGTHRSRGSPWWPAATTARMRAWHRSWRAGMWPRRAMSAQR